MPSARSRNIPPGVLFQPRPARLLHQSRQEILRLVEILRRMFVEDHDVRAQPLDPPVLLRKQDLPDERQRVDFRHPDEGNRHIAGNAVAPEVGLSQGVGARDRPG